MTDKKEESQPSPMPGEWKEDTPLGAKWPEGLKGWCFGCDKSTGNDIWCGCGDESDTEISYSEMAKIINRLLGKAKEEERKRAANIVENVINRMRENGDSDLRQARDVCVLELHNQNPNEKLSPLPQ